MGSYIPPERNNFLQQVLPLVQVLNMLKGSTVGEADALIKTKRPGSTVQDIGLSKKQMKAKFGRELAPTDVAEAPNATQVADNQLVSFLQNADPEMIKTISASMASRMAGVPQITTPTGLTSQAQASEISSATAVTEAGTKQKIAQNNQQLVGEALRSLSEWKPATRAAFAEKQTLGTTQAEQENVINSERIKSEIQRAVLLAAADPEKSDLNKALKTFTGVSLGGAMAAAGLGLTGLLTSIADMTTANIKTGRSLEAEMMLQMNKADTDWAGDVAKSLGGKASPRAILNWKRWREGGGDPTKLPAGVSPELNSALETAQTASYKAFLVEASQKGDVEAQTLLGLIKAASTVKDENTLKAISQLSARYMARTIMNSTVGMRPTDPQAAAQWDAGAKAIESRTPTLSPHTFLMFGSGVDLAQPSGRPSAAQFPPSLPTGAPTAPTAAGATSQTGIPFQEIDPADQQSVMEFLKALREFNQTQQPGIKKP